MTCHSLDILVSWISHALFDFREWITYIHFFSSIAAAFSLVSSTAKWATDHSCRGPRRVGRYNQKMGLGRSVRYRLWGNSLTSRRAKDQNAYITHTWIFLKKKKKKKTNRFPFEFIVLSESFSQLMPKVNTAKSGPIPLPPQEIYHRKEVILGQKRSIP